ncbi:MAG: hypothetical protein HUU35_20485, partial [Armatimonadetes bacterium]|nr:hypothetical protein [Armatimonadota bacterium]
AALLRGPQLFCLDPAANHLQTDQLPALVVDPASLRAEPDHGLRPGGLAGRLQANGRSLRFREFPDPGGQLTYLPLSDPSCAVGDELDARA